MIPLVTKESFESVYSSDFQAKFQSSVYSRWFPLYPSEELSGLIADITGDGHLQGLPKWRFDYTSASKQELKRFENSLFKTFGIKGKARKCSTNKFGETFNYGVNCKPLSRVLFLCGAPAGNKTNTAFKVPGWISADKKLFSAYCRRLFSCEACVEVKEKSITIEMYKREDLASSHKDYMQSLSDLLQKHFNIKTTRVFGYSRRNKRKDGTISKPLKFKIKNKDSIIKFYNEIGFDDKQKQRKLKSIISTWVGKQPRAA
ncbi:hypothetical protein H0N95_02055 [Candidatus Micrarchaeota archaeon]|nr:hypothetical protein [Candidatus Micrarchaeota archaeon]